MTSRPRSSEIMALSSRGLRGSLGLLLEGHAERGLAGEGDLAGDHFVDDDPQGIDVRALVDLGRLRLLGRHVLGRADHDAGTGEPRRVERPGDAEIHHLGVPLAVDHDVLGLEVAVDDAQPVRLGQPLGDLLGDRQRLGLGEMSRPPDEALEVLAGHILHGDVVHLPQLRPGRTCGRHGDGRSCGRT